MLRMPQNRARLPRSSAWVLHDYYPSDNTYYEATQIVGDRRIFCSPEIPGNLAAFFLRRLLRRLLAANPRGAAPFMIARQPVGAPFFLAQPCAESRGIVPPYVDDRMGRVLRKIPLLDRPACFLRKHRVILHPRIPNGEQKPIPAGGSAANRHGDKLHPEA